MRIKKFKKIKVEIEASAFLKSFKLLNNFDGNFWVIYFVTFVTEF